ncbi:MAG: helicase HerA-like domain-containing protein, partial [Burkholderiaceae bacterium]
QLVGSPRLYAVFLMWLLSALYERLAEAGDLEKPRLVFFFDEAHLLFKDAPAALLEKVEQIVRLIRSKGVGVWFVTQNPADVPDTVLGQLGNRVQHALRAYTPRDEQAVKVAARTMRPNPGLDIQAAMVDLAVGEALVSLLDEKGRPSPTQRLWVTAPRSRIGPADAAHLQAIKDSSVYLSKYDRAINRQSAHEVLAAGRDKAGGPSRPGSAENGASAPAKPAPSVPGRPGPSAPTKTAPPTTAKPPRTWTDGVSDAVFGSVGPRGGRRDGLLQVAVKTTVRTGVRALVRSLTSMFKGKR